MKQLNGLNYLKASAPLKIKDNSDNFYNNNLLL